MDTTVLAEGTLNFTLFLEENHTGTVQRESITAFYSVNNHAAPTVEIVAPDTEDLITGLTDITVNITSDYANVNVTIFVDGEIVEDYNNTLKSGCLFIEIPDNTF